MLLDQCQSPLWTQAAYLFTVVTAQQDTQVNKLVGKIARKRKQVILYVVIFRESEVNFTSWWLIWSPSNSLDREYSMTSLSIRVTIKIHNKRKRLRMNCIVWQNTVQIACTSLQWGAIFHVPYTVDLGTAYGFVWFDRLQPCFHLLLDLYYSQLCLCGGWHHI